MAYINGKNIPFVYHGVPVPSTVKMVQGIFTAEGGETNFTKRDLGFKPDILIWSAYEIPTDLAETDTSYAIRDEISDFTYNILYGDTSGEVLGTATNTKPIRLYSNGFQAWASKETGATFGAGNTYLWIAIKSEE